MDQISYPPWWYDPADCPWADEYYYDEDCLIDEDADDDDVPYCVNIMTTQYTKAQCKNEIHLLDQLITESWLNPYLTAPLTEMRIIWIERLGELVKQDEGVFPGRKFHP
jgi:hypothetical protein